MTVYIVVYLFQGVVQGPGAYYKEVDAASAVFANIDNTGMDHKVVTDPHTDLEQFHKELAAWQEEHNDGNQDEEYHIYALEVE